MIKGVNMLMNKREFDEFFEYYDSIFEKEMEKIMESGGLSIVDDSESIKENSSKNKLFFPQKAPIFPVQNSQKIINNSDILNTSGVESIFTSPSVKNNASLILPNNSNSNNLPSSSNNSKAIKGDVSPTRKNSQHRSFLKEPESQPNPRHQSMIPLNPFRNERKKTLDSGSFFENSNLTNKSKLDDIMEEPLQENENLLTTQKQQQSPRKSFERSFNMHPSILSYRSDTSQLLQPPSMYRGDYDSNSSFTKFNFLKTETENSILPSFINIKPMILENKDNNTSIEKNRNPNNKSLYLTNTNLLNSSLNSSCENKTNHDLFLPMDACAEFQIYLPHNNCNYVVEHLTKSKHIIKTISIHSRIMNNVMEEINIKSPSPRNHEIQKKKKNKKKTKK